VLGVEIGLKLDPDETLELITAGDCSGVREAKCKYGGHVVPRKTRRVSFCGGSST